MSNLMRGRRSALAATLLAILAAGCSSIPSTRLGRTSALVAPTPHLEPAQREAKAVELLGRGDARAARAEIIALLAARPSSAAAQRLLDEIDVDPRTLLGGRGVPHLVKPAETLTSLAERFLGDGRLFYALARYNGINVPNNSLVGRTILIPRRAKAVVMGRQPAAAPAPTPAVAVARVRDPAGASRLRAAGLEAMNGGKPDLAVKLLAQARALDPENTAIEGEYGRAQRLELAVHGRP